MVAKVAPAITSLDDLLLRICIGLQLSPTDYKLAVDHYQAIGNYLQAKGSPIAKYNPDIYPQGSLRIGTTVKPRGRQEYDLDLVCELLGLNWKTCPDPVGLLNDIERWLKANGLYKDKVERMNRCVRLNYEHQFHLDILPACPDGASGYCCVVVPDRKVDGWKPSNPKGYAEWFERMAKSTEFEAYFKAIEPMPHQEPLELKPPLKRAVQLIKRYRDIELGFDSKAAISIVLTTLSAENYFGQESVNEALLGILEGIVAKLPSDSSILVVKNPMNEDEKFSERWEADPKLYTEFKDWITEFRDEWRAVNLATGLAAKTPRLSKLFGEERVMKALEFQAESMNRLRSSESLGVEKATGIITSVKSAGTVTVLKNNYYGEEQVS
jgi:Second Messenger Oligonucleotide or Dinucleotide Synthetase domain